ncbi:MAG TPA: diacylglycerol kinase family protein [Candidatus Cybelea sp.]|nr:diacylglycerol kinase family protein [Candidatus Cybelea sp.]
MSERPIASAFSRTARVICVLNYAAGTSRPEAADLFRRVALEHGNHPEVLLPEPGTDLMALARHAATQQPDILVAGGGDGTLNAAAAALLGSKTSLGVLPLGTLNHFAKDVGIPLELETAARTIFTGRTAALDVGVVNDHVFINNSSLGLYPRIVRQREAHQRLGHSKWIAFAKALAYVTRHPRSIYLRIRIDGAGARSRRTPFVFIGNNRYEIAGLNIGKRTSLAGETLWVCQAPDTDHWGLLRLTLRALSGRLRDSDLEATEAREVWIETRPHHAVVSTDGEVWQMRPHLHYTTMPKALKVIVPADRS